MTFGKDTSPITRGMLGKHHTKEAKEKISLAHIGKNLGFHHSEETKKKMREKALGNNNSCWKGNDALQRLKSRGIIKERL
jgi:hypothetical protein